MKLAVWGILGTDRFVQHLGHLPVIHTRLIRASCGDNGEPIVPLSPRDPAFDIQLLALLATRFT